MEPFSPSHKESLFKLIDACLWASTVQQIDYHPHPRDYDLPAGNDFLVGITLFRTDRPRGQAYSDEYPYLPLARVISRQVYRAALLSPEFPPLTRNLLDKELRVEIEIFRCGKPLIMNEDALWPITRPLMLGFSAGTRLLSENLLLWKEASYRHKLQSVIHNLWPSVKTIHVLDVVDRLEMTYGGVS